MWLLNKSCIYSVILLCNQLLCSAPVVLIAITSSLSHFPSPISIPHFHPSHNMPDTAPPSKFVQFKLVLLGESAVGKSSIVHRFVKNTFDDMRESTIGAAFLTQTITLDDRNTTIKFEIWDTAGQERYKSLAPMYYRNANAALCVYDITTKSLFVRAQSWITELKRQAPEGIVIALVGNKADMEDEREVTKEDVEAYIQSINQEDGSRIISAECSAKDGNGVLEIFTQIGKALPLESAAAPHPSGIGSRGPGGVDLTRTHQPSLASSSCC